MRVTTGCSLFVTISPVILSMYVMFLNLSLVNLTRQDGKYRAQNRHRAHYPNNTSANNASRGALWKTISSLAGSYLSFGDSDTQIRTCLIVCPVTASEN
ncbi:hypothetical protein BC834DRAFT_669563 [Gloeopeniophorella convolvens]|nr:hypothetical protein BC834DRAFT_669563 [Gloeopeniophorella convolvens]